MIVREHPKGKSFKGLTQYLTHDKDAQTSERVEFAHTRNLRSTNPDDAAFEMMLTWQQRNILKEAYGAARSGRDTTHPVLHFSLSWAEDESPSYDEMIEAGEQSLQALGLEDHQAVLIAHNDEDHPHLHIMVNRVHPYTGITNSIAYSWKKFSRFAQQLETANGKIYCLQRVENNAARDQAAAERGIDPDKAFSPVKDRSPSRKQWFEQRRLAARLWNLDASLSDAKAMEIAENALRQSRAAWRKQWAEVYRTQREEGLRLGLIQPKGGAGLPVDPDVVLATLTQNDSTFTRADIAKYLHLATDTHDAFTAALAAIESHSHLISLGAGPDGRERLTTLEMQSVEEAMIAHAQSMSGRNKFALDPLRIRNQLLHTNLSDEQAAACVHITAGHDLANVIGFAGTGKSTMLGVAKDIWSNAGYTVQGGAFTGIAARALQGGSGIQSRTLHSLEYAWEKNPQTLNDRTVLVIDEAGMVGSRQLERVLRKAHDARAKVVMVGDPEQLQSIAAGAAFRAIEERTGAAAITHVRRQHQEWQCAATIDLATNKTTDAIARYEAAGMVHAHDTKQTAADALIDQWNGMRQAAPNETHFIFAHRRADVRTLNKKARDCMRKSGDLDRADHVINSERGSMRVGIGERLRFTRNDYDLGVMNGTLGTLAAVDRAQLTVRLDGDKPHHVTIDLTQYDHIDYGYASTVHKSQGVTVDHGHLLATPGLDRHATYVALSRHRETVNMHWGEDDFYSRDNMVSKIARERPKDTTLDYDGPTAPHQQALTTDQDRARYIFDNRERLHASGDPLTDSVMVELSRSPDMLRTRVEAMHAFERQHLSELQMDHATKIARDVLYEHRPTPAPGIDEAHNMPFNEKGEWVPEAHKADAHGHQNAAAAQKTADAFSKVAAPETGKQSFAEARPPVQTSKTITRALTPGSTALFGNTAHGHAQEDQLRKISDAHRQRQFNDDQKTQRVVQAKQEFARQNSRSHDRSRGRVNRENER